MWWIVPTIIVGVFLLLILMEDDLIEMFHRSNIKKQQQERKIEEDYMASCAFLKIIQFVENDKGDSYEIIIKSASKRLLNLLTDAYQNDNRVMFVDSLPPVTSGLVGLETSIILRNKPNVEPIRLIKLKGDSDIEENLNSVILALEKQ